MRIVGTSTNVPINEALRRKLEQAYRDELSLSGRDSCLWPDDVAEGTFETRMRFIEKYTWTWHDTERSARTIEIKPYIEEFVWHWGDTYEAEEPLIVFKSRRLVISWIARALELHDFGRATGTMKLVGKTWPLACGHVWRHLWLYEQIRLRHPKLALGEGIGYGSEAARQCERVVLPNQSIFEAMNAQESSFRGTGDTRVVCEELGDYRYIDDIWSQAILITQGSVSRDGTRSRRGHVVAISNASPNREWKLLKEPSNLPRSKRPLEPEPVSGTEVWQSKTGLRVLSIHYSADPAKTPEWVARERPGMPTRKWLREMEMREDVYEGDPVFPDYEEPVHCPQALQFDSWTLTPHARSYILGIDCGNTIWPGAVLIEVGPNPWNQLAVVKEWTAQQPTPMSVFCPIILDDLMRILPGRWDDVEWVGDQTVGVRQGAEGKTAQDIALEHGVYISPMSNQLQGRLGATTWALTDRITDTAPRMFVCGKDCPVLLEGFRGGYCLIESLSRENSDLKVPTKNHFSHVQDALQYALLRAKEKVEYSAPRVHRGGFDIWGDQKTPSIGAFVTYPIGPDGRMR